MVTVTHDTSRTIHLLALMKKGDDAFNSREVAAMDATHHPDMIAHVAGRAEPIRGPQAHAAMIVQMVRIFPDIHVHNDPYQPSSEVGTGSRWSPAPQGRSPGR